MCGRYVRKGDKQRIAEAFHAKEVPTFAMPDEDYNIAPTTYQPIVRQSKDTGERELVSARWGLIPFFTKDMAQIKGLSTINAKAETIATSPTWRPMYFDLDPRPFFEILHNLLRQEGLEYDPEKTAGTVDWVLTNSSLLRKITSQAEWGCVQAFYAHWDAHKIAPTRKMMDTLLHQKQKCEPMLDVMAEYDKHAEDLEQVDALSLDLYLDQRREDYEKYKLNQVLSLATLITVGSVPMNDKAKTVYTGPRDALKYLARCQQEGILLDDARSQGGDTATKGIKAVALRVARAAEGYGNAIPTLTPIDKVMTIGPEGPIRYVGIVGFSNQRKSTLLFTFAYLAAAHRYRVLFVPRECSVEDAWMRFVWLHARRIGRIHELPYLSDATNPRKLTRAHAKVIAEVGESMLEMGIRIEVRDCPDWGSIQNAVNAHVDDPYDLLCIDYIAHLDTPGERDQREGVRGVYRKAQALSLEYERGRGLVVMTPVQANKSTEKIAAEPEPLMERGIYRRDIGAIEYHTDAGREMDAAIGIWSGEGFSEHGLARISCIKSRQLSSIHSS